MKISIITATYNRANTLPQLYESLLKQNSVDSVDFEWILVDDGSFDNTEELVKQWKLENKIDFKYLKKINEGKTRAVNYGFLHEPKGDFTFVLDSDDYLSDNSLEIMTNNLRDLPDHLIGIIGLKYYNNGNLVGSKFKENVNSYINIYFGKNPILGDKLFVIRTEIYKKSIVLPFDGEKFMPDNLPYIRANSIGGYKLINECFYIGDYLEDGMTSNVKRMAMNNIQGYIFEKKELQKEILSSKNRIINTVKFINYCILNKMSRREIINYSEDKFLTSILYMPTFLLLFNIRKLYKI